MPLLTTARFHTTVAALHQMPREGLLEVAFVGRSNAGKSSAINVLCNRRRLAFASRTPGRTQALNYFAVGPVDRAIAYLVDTPGYGYASAPLETKRTWDQLAGEYLSSRPQLAGTVLMADIRRKLTDLDRRLLAWVPDSVRLVVTLTKSDKLPRQQARQALRDVIDELEQLRPGADNKVLLFSALNRSGSDDLTAVVENWIAVGLPASPKETTNA
ncbi:MAG: ribosome biogenesis GTP-binding protein YihA/YsxC [Burkholderiales bacterium]|jgi:GTP-binding protein|nr:ribosome biogenesis GTP-binding protein YihA/YsxC [Burkholderiales bacterium]